MSRSPEARGLAIVFALAVVWPAEPARGQARQDSARVRADSAAAPVPRPPARLPDLQVRIRRPPRPLTTYRLERSSLDLAGPSVADWVRGLPGVQTRGRGAGGVQTLSLRGSRAEEVRVTLDGIPLDDPLTGVTDLSTLPSASLESATLAAGAGRAAGAGGTAGVLTLRSREVESGVRMGAAAGSYGRRSTRLEAGWRNGTVRAGAFGFLERARNDYTFRNRIRPGEPEERRLNADRNAWTLLARGGLIHAPLRFLVRADGLDRGSPGRMGNHVWDAARWGERRTAVGAAWSDPERAGASLSWSRRTTRFEDGRRGEPERTSADQVGLRGAVAGPGGTLFRWEGVRASLRGDALEGTRIRWLGGLRISRTTALGSGLELETSLGADAAREGLALSPSLGVAARWGDRWSAWGRVSSARRLPTFADLFLRPGLGVRPNPDVRPERVEVDAEASIGWSSGVVEARLTGFWRRTRDPIVWLPSVVAIWSPDNLGRLAAAGLEARGRWRPHAALLVEGSTTLQRSRLRPGEGRDRPLPYEPALAAGLTLTWTTSARAARASLDWVGRRPSNLFAPHELPGYALLNIRASQAFYIVGLTAKLVVGVTNALGSDYERVELFPEPGRRFEIGIRVGPGPAGLPRASAGGTVGPRARAPSDSSNGKEPL